MAVLHFACPSCAAALKVRDLPPGKRIACPKCKNVFGPPAAAPAKPAAGGWCVSRGGKKSGPYPLPMVKQMAAAGRLARDDQLLPDGATEWVAAGSFKSLFPAPAAEEEITDVGAVIEDEPPGESLELADEPQADAAPARPRRPPPKRRKSSMGLLLLVATFVILLAGGAVAAYLLWPDLLHFNFK